MKNTLLKVWGIVLTLAILSGLLMATVPVAAADNAWTDGNFPIPSMGNQTNIYTIAGDGTTMFLWTPTATAVSKSVAVGDFTINVSSTIGFPTSGNIKIDGGVDISYVSTTATSFVLTPAPGTGSPVAVTVFAGAGPTSPPTSAIVTAGTGTTAAALYKSVDAGKTWSTSSLTSPASNITMIKINPNDANQLVATDGANLYRSVTGGRVWTTAIAASTILAGSSTIYSLDITTDSNGTTILVGTNTGVSKLDGALGSWSQVGASSWTPGDMAMAVAFSPGYIDSQQILAVAVTAGGVATLRVIVPPASGTSNQWGKGLNDGPMATSGAITSVSLAFPNDFAASSKVFVGINGGTGFDVYRVTLVNYNISTPTAVSIVKATSLSQNVTSLVVIGSGSNATILAGLAAGNVYSSADADTAAAPTWALVAKSPIGVNVMLAAVDTTVYAGTATFAPAYAAFFVSTDMNVFNGISFFQVPNVYTVGVSVFGPNAWMTSGTTFNRLFMNTASGWQMVLDNGSNGWGVPTGAAGSKTMYFTQNANKTLLQKTTDGGQTWATVGTGFRTVTALTVIDDNTYWIGYTGFIKRTDGVALPISTVSEDPSRITIIGDGILVQTGAGTFLYSADKGVTFSVLGTVGQWSGRPTTYVAAEKTVYGVDASNNVYKWTLGTSTAWTLVGALVLPAAGTIGAIGVADGVFYLDMNTTNVGDSQLWRSTVSINEFRAISGTSKTAMKGAFGFVVAIANANGTHGLSGSVTYDSAIAAYPSGMPISKPVSYTDTVVAPVSLTGPVDQIFINNPVTFTWKAAAAPAPVTYKIDVAYDAAFSLGVANYPQYTTNTTVLNTNFATGTTYYWRVRVESALPGLQSAGAYVGVTSKYSAVQNFTIKTEGTTLTGLDVPTSVFPSRGQTGVSTSPVLTWGTVPGATYNIKVATDSGFNTVVDSKDGLSVAVYTPATALKANTTYYWEVQAVANNIMSDWVAFAFTTAPVVAPTTSAPPTVTQPVVTPTVIVTMPTQPTQAQPTIIVTVPPSTDTSSSTPAWAWIVIAIGAVLVIAVIVLIVRTRRV